MLSAVSVASAMTLVAPCSAPVETPYQRASQEWDRRIGAPVIQARNWRAMPTETPPELLESYRRIYSDETAYYDLYRLLEDFIEFDERFLLWRSRHVLMVERMIGRKIGTGGSSGHDYLRSTAERHRIFSDLFQLSTFLIPRSSLPELPADVRRRLGFVYASAP